jgi:N-carbamoylputrescine amidase
MPRVRIAAAAAHFGRDLNRSMERITTVILAARRIGASLLVLPAAALGGYLGDVGVSGADALPTAVAPDAPEFDRIAAAVGDLVVCLGYTEFSAGRRWDAAVCLTSDEVLGRYRKVHQQPAEAELFSAGDQLAAFDTPIGRMGMLIDYDKTFPEAARTLALDGARLVACLSAWPAGGAGPGSRLPQDRQSRLFDVYDSARAAENQIVWVSANQTGSGNGLRFLGQAKVVGPGGEVLARTWGKAGLAVAEVEVDAAVDEARSTLHHLPARRPDLYLEK